MADARTPHEQALNVSLTSPEQDVSKPPGEDRPPRVPEAHRVERAGPGQQWLGSEEAIGELRRAVEARPGAPLPGTAGRQIPGGREDEPEATTEAVATGGRGAATAAPTPADYEQLIRVVSGLPFITSDVQANEAVRCVLEVLAGRLPEDEARLLTRHLPEALSLERLREPQARPTAASRDESFAAVGQRLNLTEGDARSLVRTILRAATQALEDPDRQRLGAALPEDWRALIDAA